MRDDAALDLFSPGVRRWFEGAFSAPTAVQAQAWKAIATGDDTLVVAPTGSGKTLAAFLFAIDRLVGEHARCEQAGERRQHGVRVLYVSPLKALGADVERNLAQPLAGIADAAAGGSTPITVGMRTGDTAPDARRKLQRTPPDILITTPESLYLMLTSQARSILASVQTVIVDEIHAMAGSKRGAHLSLSLERLRDLRGAPFQRVGLSATVEPVSAVARFLGGTGSEVTVVRDEEPAAFDLSVTVPVSDMTAIPRLSDPPLSRRDKKRAATEPASGSPRSSAWKSDRAMRAFLREEQNAASSALPPDTGAGSASIWPYIEAAILDEVLAHTSTIVFVNSRGLCERLTAHLNELYAKRCGAREASIAALDTGAGPSIRSEIGSTSELASPIAADAVIAKAHHGSVSKEKRLAVESELKRGALPCVVATSSLELGIDMGEVDLVLQVAPPLSVASGLQRIGRANHQVKGRSQGIMFPRVRTEVIDCAVIAEGMRQRRIERTEPVRNALDVLAQQTTAAVAMAPEGLAMDEWYATVRRSACYEELPRSAFDAVLWMLAGRYAHGGVADFAPRISIDVEAGLLKPLARTQRLAVTGAGTIPDRGLFPVMLARGDDHSAPVPGMTRGASPSGKRSGRKRVGELDEEMVAESRVGDVIILGTSSWRIAEIADDRVLVEPAPGRTARLPFWHGEGPGRPLDAGARKGAFLREASEALAPSLDSADEGPATPALPREAAQAFSATMRQRLCAIGLGENAMANLALLLAEQRRATGAVPTDRTLVLERCADEAGGWSMILHSPFGRRIHEPWALAIAERGARLLDYDLQASAADDGIVMHIPLHEPVFPDPSLLLFDPDQIEAVVRNAVGTTALFATRFRECAARALLMSPTMPGKRAPLWQQRLRGGQLLEAAREAGDFPLLAEAARECLQEVYDLDGLRQVMEALDDGRISIAEADTPLPSPFAVPLLFGYMTQHLYEGDLPHAERQASLLAVDSTLLGELVGGGDVTTLLDDTVIEAVEAELQWLAPDRAATSAEAVAEMLRRLGPLSFDGLLARTALTEEGSEAVADPSTVLSALLAELARDRRIFPVVLGGEERWAAVEDGRRLAAVLGCAVPVWANALTFGANQTEPEATEGNSDSAVLIDSLLARYGRTHGPFTVGEAARALTLGEALIAESAARLRARGTLAQGAFTEAVQQAHDADGPFWIALDVLRPMRLRSLAKAREAVRPVGADIYGRFLFARQGITAAATEPLQGIDGLAETIALFEGVSLPRNLWEDVVFPARVNGFEPRLLDELLESGEVIWRGRRDGDDHQSVAFFPTDSPFAPVPLEDAEVLAAFSPEPGEDDGTLSVRTILLRTLAEESGLSFPTIAERTRRLCSEERSDAPDDAAIARELLDLLWSGDVAVDSFALARTVDFEPETLVSDGITAASTRPAPRRASSRRGRGRYRSELSDARRNARAQVLSRSAAHGALAGHWSIVSDPCENDTLRAMAIVESLFDRYGIITPDIAAAHGVKGGMSVLYPVLRSLEDAGEVLRGTFVEGLGRLQFAAQDTIDALRLMTTTEEGSGPLVLAADDPAQLYGAVLPWPSVSGGEGSEARAARRNGALVVFEQGEPVLWAAPRLKALLSFTASEDAIERALEALVNATLTSLRRAGTAGARTRILIETLDGAPILATPFADRLRSLGLVRDTKGLRLYISPF